MIIEDDFEERGYELYPADIVSRQGGGLDHFNERRLLELNQAIARGEVIDVTRQRAIVPILELRLREVVGEIQSELTHTEYTLVCQMREVIAKLKKSAKENESFPLAFTLGHIKFPIAQGLRDREHVVRCIKNSLRDLGPEKDLENFIDSCKQQRLLAVEEVEDFFNLLRWMKVFVEGSEKED